MNDDKQSVPVPIALPPFGPSDWAERELRQFALQKAVDTSSQACLLLPLYVSVLVDAQKYYDWLIGTNVADDNKKEDVQ